MNDNDNDNDKRCTCWDEPGTLECPVCSLIQLSNETKLAPVAGYVVRSSVKSTSDKLHGCHDCGEERQPRMVAGKPTCPECGSERIVCIESLALLERIQEYLGNGGLLNPEMMEHDKVRDLITDCQQCIKEHHETIAWIGSQENLFFAECSQAEEIVARCRALLEA